MPHPGDFERARSRLSKAAAGVIAKIQAGPLAPFLTDAAGEGVEGVQPALVPAYSVGEYVEIGDQTWRVGYAKGDTLVLERVRPEDALRWDGEADPPADMRSSRQMDRLREAELNGEFPPPGGW